jgi:hypothetical protein
MRAFNVEDSNPQDMSHRLEEFKTAAFGTECRTISFLDISQAQTHKAWLQAAQDVDGTWSVTHCTVPLGDDPDLITAQTLAEKDLSMFAAISRLAEYESSARLNELSPSGEDTEEELGYDHFKAFGVREAVAFDAVTGMPHMSVHGNITNTGEFTNKMRADVKKAYEAKRRLFSLPAMDIKKALGNAKRKLSVQEMKDILRNKESFPAFVNKFESYIKMYQRAAKEGFRDIDTVKRVEDYHNDLEESIELFPDGKWPDKKSLTMLLANAHVYFTLQQLNGRFVAAHERSQSSEFIEEVVIEKLEAVQNYYGKVAGVKLPDIDRMLECVLGSHKIEGFPPTEILEHFDVLQSWVEMLRTGMIFSDATLPEIIPVEEYMPKEVQAKDVSGNLEKIKDAERIVEFAKAFGNFIHRYQDFSSAGFEDRYVRSELEKAHNEAEELAVALPENSIFEKDVLINLVVQAWLSIEMKHMKATVGYDNDDVAERLERLANYRDRILSKHTSGFKKSREWKKKFVSEGRIYVSDVTTKIPDTIEPELKEANDRLQKFREDFLQIVMEGKHDATKGKKRGAPSPA